MGGSNVCIGKGLVAMGPAIQAQAGCAHGQVVGSCRACELAAAATKLLLSGIVGRLGLSMRWDFAAKYHHLDVCSYI